LAEIDERKEPIIRADVAIRCAESAGKVLLLTGTAVYNNPLDIVNLVAMVKGIKPPTKNAFQKILDSPTEFRNFFKCVLSFYKASESSDYPTVKEHYVEIEMTPSYLRSYQAVEMQSHHLFSESNPWRFLTGVRQASNALEECIKCEWILEKAKTGIKILIYSAFISYGIKQVQELFVSNKIKFLEITGSMSKSKRSAAVEDFNNGVVNVLFITKAGGEGLDLKGTRAVIFLESSWNRPNEEQVIGRARRYKSHSHLPPSERKVDVYHLLMVKPKKLVDPDKWIKTKKDGIKEYPSADSMLKQMVDEKDKTAKQFLARVYPLTIDQSKC
jgi:superfamily II DNA or RNA helicase